MAYRSILLGIFFGATLMLCIPYPADNDIQVRWDSSPCATPQPTLTATSTPSPTILCTTTPVLPPRSCPTCNSVAGLNFCDVTTSCIDTPSGGDYCACRAGYRADGLSPTDPQQFRLNFPNYEFLVFVAPGVSCNTLCTTPFPGPDSCQEVPIQGSC